MGQTGWLEHRKTDWEVEGQAVKKVVGKAD